MDTLWTSVPPNCIVLHLFVTHTVAKHAASLPNVDSGRLADTRKPRASLYTSLDAANSAPI
eukprot:6665038-Prymnesium_polylepis.1